MLGEEFLARFLITFTAKKWYMVQVCGTIARVTPQKIMDNYQFSDNQTRFPLPVTKQADITNTCQLFSNDQFFVHTKEQTCPFGASLPITSEIWYDGFQAHHCPSRCPWYNSNGQTYLQYLRLHRLRSSFHTCCVWWTPMWNLKHT